MEKTVYSDEGRRLARLLRQIRYEAGLTQAELATRLEVPRQMISRLELGERRVDLVELDAICDALGASTISVVWRFLARMEEPQDDTPPTG